MAKIDIFPQDLWYWDLPVFFDIKESLLKEVYSLKNTTPSVKISNINGWQSPSVFDLKFRSNNLKILLSRIGDHIKNDALQYSYNYNFQSLWFNINHPGCLNFTHNHPGCELTGIFYLKVPEPAKESGELLITNPNFYQVYNYLRCSTNPQNGEYRIEPKEGRFYLFPAFLYHSVLTNNTNEDRISFACNISISDNKL
jgi:uncharacterized protein (TIGR02466 family)